MRPANGRAHRKEEARAGHPLRFQGPEQEVRSSMGFKTPYLLIR